VSGAIPTIAEAARQIAARQLSPIELTRACLDRVHKLDRELHAFVHLTEERALADARAAEAAIMANGPTGALHGIPIGLKDIVDTKGIPTTCQSKLLQDNIPDADATCAEKLATAGTVLIGKTTTHEFAMAARLSICRSRRRAIHGAPSTSPPAAAAAPAPEWRRG
jgi:aspartyl-tRNA(Asn)/glutamyl-tRNA(Gln) amidotransferase subunit A